jgi:hypothetical protein
MVPAAAVDSLLPQVGECSDQALAERRHEMIATEAYLRAAERGFVPCLEIDDWLAAEAIIDARLEKRADNDGQGMKGDPHDTRRTK